jgi:alpha-glucosidase (family GH31 glycosyl hydrolase)
VWEDNGNTRASTEAVVGGYLSRQIPVGAVIVDSPWETGYNTLVWDTSRYPSPTDMISQFHAKGVKVIMWTTAFVDTDTNLYQTVKQQGYGVNGGQTFTWWKGTGIHIDVTNPAAASWWNARMGAVLAAGVDGWKLDQGADSIGNPIQTAAGSLSVTDFKKRLSADFFDYTTTTNPNGIIMVRPYAAAQGGIGSDLAKCSIGWVGDHDGGFGGIASELSDIYTSAQLGYGAPGVEVGGYSGAAPSKNSLIRYAQFGAVTPLMENGGANGGQSQHLPWYWDATTVGIYQYFATLHSELGSYNFSYGVDAHLTGASIIRGSDKTHAQHLLGDQLFASVITTDVTTKSVTFPTGSNWIDYWNEDTVYTGGTTTQYSAPLAQYPLFIKTGAIIPLDVKTAVTGHGDATSAGTITVLVYPQGKSNFTFHRPLGEGTAYSDVAINVDAVSGTVTVAGSASASYRLRVKSMQAPTNVAGADTWSYDVSKKVIVVEKQGASFSVVINGLKGYS